MKVKIGPYENWWSAYKQIRWLTDWIERKYGEKNADKVCDAYCDFVQPILNFIHNDRKIFKRKIFVQIDGFDAWSADSTLAYIIHPLLIKVKQAKHGAPHTDDEDVPEELRSIAAAPKENEWDVDDSHFKRWDWILDEMIWAFSQLNEDWEAQYHIARGESRFVCTNPDEPNLEKRMYEMVWDKEPEIDWDGRQKHQERIDRGLRLFGKYFRCLWT